MRPDEYRVMFRVEDEHWWFVGRRRIVFSLISDHLSKSTSREILDIGCGTGANLGSLSKFGRAQGLDLALLPLTLSRQRGHQRIVCASANSIPFADRSFDLVTALDVIEHLEDDLGGLKEICRVLKPGATAAFFVPAFMQLWGPNDVRLGHFRRYRRESFQALLAEAGLQVEMISYANFAMFLPVWIGRRIMTLLGRTGAGELEINHRLINRLLTWLFSIEARWLRHYRFPFGVSVVCVARRPE